MDFSQMFTDAFAQAIEQFRTMLGNAIAFTPQFIAGLVIGVLGFFVARIVRRWGRRASRRIEAPESVERLIVNAIYVGALLIVATVALAAMGVQVYPLIAGLGVSGLIVGFALKDIIENLMAGALLLIQRPFELGHDIEIDDVRGIVTSINIRATTLKTLDNLEVIIPNRVVYTNRVTNYNTYAHRRRRVNLGIGYGEDLPGALQVLLDAANSVEGVAQDPAAFMAMDDFGDSAMTGKLYYYIDVTQHSFPETHNRVLHALHEAAGDMDIDLPYPTSVVINK